eukprot:tig00000254_g22489.t1
MTPNGDGAGNLVPTATTFASYLNGVARTPGATSFAKETGGFARFGFIGQPTSGGPPFLSGVYLSGFRLWNTALTAAQVTSLYQGSGAVGSVNLYYRFDDSSFGTTVKARRRIGARI